MVHLLWLHVEGLLGALLLLHDDRCCSGFPVANVVDQNWLLLFLLVFSFPADDSRKLLLLAWWLFLLLVGSILLADAWWTSFLIRASRGLLLIHHGLFNLIGDHHLILQCECLKRSPKPLFLAKRKHRV